MKRVHLLRGQLVLLDADLAELYGISSERLRELVQRNQSIFSVEFAFAVEPNEMRNLKLQLATNIQNTDQAAPLEKSIAMLDTKTRGQFEAIYRAIDKYLAPPASDMRSDRKPH
jgi:ORF6N domain-containing protein